MNRFLTALVLLAGALTGCMQEDWSLCDEENCVLRYRYLDAAGRDAFAGNIGTVDLLLFDRGGYLVDRYRSSEEDLARFRGVSISLPEGEYYAVAWANLDPDKDLAVSTLTASVVETGDGSGMPLFYAPSMEPLTRAGARPDSEMEAYKITVPRRGIIERDLDFTRAHRRVNVFIKGYGDGESRLEVEMAHAAYAYDFMLRVEPGRRTHRAVAEPRDTPAGTIPAAGFNTPYQEIEPKIEITIKNNAGEAICPPVNLRRFLVDSGSGLDPLALHEINILVEFAGGEVTLRLPDWNDNEVGPDW